MNTEKIGNVVMNYDYYSGQDLYSDGDIEDTLLDIVKNHDRSEFPNIIVESKSWPILYHLSEVRTNILNWYPFEADAHVLEVGAGCGAITGAIAAKAEKVVAIDLSKRRSMINAYRNRDKDNIEIIVGNFNDVAAGLAEKFDYVTLIGVLEYGELYIPGNDSYRTFLKKIAGLLKPNGKVLIAIENQLGLKYFAGCREDHVGKYFEGIEGYTTTNSVKTFSKKVLKELVESSGYVDVKFAYPYPDYKLPTTIYTDEFLPVKGELVNNLRNFDADRMVFFDETKVWDTMIEAGLFDEFSNSFFVEATNPSKEAETAGRAGQQTTFAKCSVERKDEYKIITRIFEENGKKLVEKYAANEKANAHVNRMVELAQTNPYLTENVCLVPCEAVADGVVRFPYIEGQRLDKVIDEAVKQGRLEDAWTEIRRLKDIIMNVSGKEAFHVTDEFRTVFGQIPQPEPAEGEKNVEPVDPLAVLEGYEAVTRVNMDMVAANIIFADKIYILDYEWNFDFAVPLKYILFRSILFNGTLNVMPEEQRKTLMEIIEISDEEWQLFLQMETSWQQFVTGTSLTDLYPDMPSKYTIVKEENYCNNPPEPKRSLPYRAARKIKRMIVAALQPKEAK